MIRMIIGLLVENLGFGEPLLQRTNVPLLQGSVASILHQARITSLEELTLESWIYCFRRTWPHA